MFPNFKVVLTDDRAKLPKKAHFTDSGFDLFLIEKIAHYDNIEVYDTFVKLEPPRGIYFDLIPRSSIIKSGYMLANGVGVIDNGYRGTLKVALTKINPTTPDLKLPCRLVQIIPRQVIHMSPELEEAFEELTKRGSGGFGSTGK